MLVSDVIKIFFKKVAYFFLIFLVFFVKGKQSYLLVHPAFDVFCPLHSSEVLWPALDILLCHDECDPNLATCLMWKAGGAEANSGQVKLISILGEFMKLCQCLMWLVYEGFS